MRRVVLHTSAADTMALLAGRGWPADRIVRAADEIRRLGFQITQRQDAELAMGLVRGMPPAAAAYAALASWLDLPTAASDPELENAFRTFPRA